MNPLHMDAVIRPRGHWEAIDLGFGMVRAWWRPLCLAWLVTVVPIWILVTLTAGLSGFLLQGFVVLWWVKPLFDRVPLYVLSRRLFGETPGVKDTLRAAPRLLTGHLFASLILYRLDPARAFNLPVWQLEGLRGRERWDRATPLQRDGYGPAQWLTACSIAMTVGLVFAILWFVALLVPDQTNAAAWNRMGLPVGEMEPWQRLVQGAVSFLAFSVIEPCYVAAGFSLYLARRTRLEGWDVEIAFRRLANRLAKRPGDASPARAAALAGIGLVAAAAMGVSKGAVAENPTAPAATVADPQAAIRHVMAQPEFETRRKVAAWRRRALSKPQREAGPEPSEIARELKSVGNRTLGTSTGAIFTAALLALLAVVLLLYLFREVPWRRLLSSRRDLERDPAAPVRARVTVSASERPVPLPQDVTGEALARWERGETAAALALLYRAAIARLLASGLLPSPEALPALTEGDLLELLGGRAGGLRAQAFGRLTGAWQAAAYAHRPPSATGFSELCAEFRRVFEARGGEP